MVKTSVFLSEDADKGFLSYKEETNRVCHVVTRATQCRQFKVVKWFGGLGLETTITPMNVIETEDVNFRNDLF